GAVYSWTGWYVGGNVGYSWGKAATDVDASAFEVVAAAVPAATLSDSNTLNGIIGGGQIGYNWQNGHWVTGLELDWQASAEKGGAGHRTEFPGQACGGPAPPFPHRGLHPGDGTQNTRFCAARGRVGAP